MTNDCLTNGWDVVGATGMLLAMLGLVEGFIQLIAFATSLFDTVPMWLVVTVIGVVIMIVGMIKGGPVKDE